MTSDHRWLRGNGKQHDDADNKQTRRGPHGFWSLMDRSPLPVQTPFSSAQWAQTPRWTMGNHLSAFNNDSVFSESIWSPVLSELPTSFGHYASLPDPIEPPQVAHSPEQAQDNFLVRAQSEGTTRDVLESRMANLRIADGKPIDNSYNTVQQRQEHGEAELELSRTMDRPNQMRRPTGSISMEEGPFIQTERARSHRRVAGGEIHNRRKEPSERSLSAAREREDNPIHTTKLGSQLTGGNIQSHGRGKGTGLGNNQGPLAKYAKQSQDTQASFFLKKTYMQLLSQEQQRQRSKMQSDKYRQSEGLNANESCDGTSSSLSPSNELVRSLKHSIRNNVPLTRLSICHANLDDSHLHILVQALRTTQRKFTLKIGELLLNHNAISDAGASKIVKDCLPVLSTVTSVELFGNRLSDSCCSAFAELLGEENSSLVERCEPNKSSSQHESRVHLLRLKLGDNNIGPAGAAALARGLMSNTHLVQLHLGGNKIGSEGLRQLSEIALVHNSTLTSLGLRDNMVEAEGMEHLSKALMQTHCALSDIQLKGNKIGPMGARFLANALVTNQSLKVLELQSNNIGPQGAQYLCEALRSNRSVHALNFNDNELGCEGAEYISELLMHNHSITTLGLANNRIRKRGAAALARALSARMELVDSQSISTSPLRTMSTVIGCSLTGLDLGNNELTNGGAVALSEALATNNVLTSLDLRQSDIHLRGVLSLAEMAKVNSTLRHLDLGGNHARNQGASAFAEVLAKNTSLTRLCLTDNQVYNEGGEALAVGLQSNYTLRNFSYGGQGPQANRIDSSIRRIIDSIVTENKRHWEKQEAAFLATGIDSTNGNVRYPSSNPSRTVDVGEIVRRLRRRQSGHGRLHHAEDVTRGEISREPGSMTRNDPNRFLSQHRQRQQQQPTHVWKNRSNHHHHRYEQDREHGHTQQRQQQQLQQQQQQQQRNQQLHVQNGEFDRMTWDNTRHHGAYNDMIQPASTRRLFPQDASGAISPHDHVSKSLLSYAQRHDPFFAPFRMPTEQLTPVLEFQDAARGHEQHGLGHRVQYSQQPRRQRHEQQRSMLNQLHDVVRQEQSDFSARSPFGW